MISSRKARAPSKESVLWIYSTTAFDSLAARLALFDLHRTFETVQPFKTRWRILKRIMRVSVTTARSYITMSKKATCFHKKSALAKRKTKSRRHFSRRLVSQLVSHKT